jgi:hypothetical protein
LTISGGHGFRFGGPTRAFSKLHCIVVKQANGMRYNAILRAQSAALWPSGFPLGALHWLILLLAIVLELLGGSENTEAELLLLGDGKPELPMLGVLLNELLLLEPVGRLMLFCGTFSPLTYNALVPKYISHYTQSHSQKLSAFIGDKFKVLH